MVHLIFDVVLTIVALSMIFFYAKRGFLKSLIHSLKGILALIIAYFFGGKLAQFISDKIIFTPVRNSVFNKIDAIYHGASDTLDAETLTAHFPDFILTEEVKAQIASAEGGGEQIVNSITDSIATPISTVISAVIGYVLVFVLAFVGLWLLASVLDKITGHFKLLSAANTILGGLMGALAATLLLLVICSIVKFFFESTEFYSNSVILKFFGDSALLKALKIFDVGALLR